ncbi:MAG: DUF63 family protein [Candidatus Thermoplasmatota archaeon]
MKEFEDIVSYYRDNKLKVWMFLLVGIPAALLIGSLLMPELFWEKFLWRYFWGPVVADAKGHTVNGVSAGYNPVNTVGYALTLIVSFFGIYEIIDYFEIEIDRKFVYSLLPWVVLGGSLRSLEDVGLFKHPLDKFMITPLIYIVLGMSALSLLIIGAWLSSLDFEGGKKRVSRLLVLLPIPIFYLSAWSVLDPYFALFQLVIFGGIFLCYRFGSKLFSFNEKYLLFSYGLVTVLLTLGYNLYYIIELPSANPIEAVLIPGIGAALTLIFFSVLWSIDRLSGGDRKRSCGVFSQPLNIVLCFSHLFDASSTYRGIAEYGYSEKHVLPEALIQGAGTPLIIFPIKLLLIVLIVYTLDVYLKEEFYEKKILVNLLKFVIIVLGAAPAVRNTLRLAMGG